MENLKESLNHWHDRRDKLAEWLVNNDYEHPNYNQNQSDYNHSICKIQQIEDHIKRLKNGPIRAGVEYSLPINMRFNNKFK